MFLEDGGRGEEGRDGALYAYNLLSSGCSGKSMGRTGRFLSLEHFLNSQPVFLLEGEQVSYSQL